jgi:hypothetical protein
MTTPDALQHLRTLLLDLSPIGADGFEGLAATGLAAISGLTVRLAKSGLQGGRDASSTPSDTYAIALEGKLYHDNLRLEHLAGKVAVAAAVLAGRVDLWALGASSEVGDETLAQLTRMLEEKGITLLALDWAERPLPPLAVLLASSRAAVLDWFGRHQPGVDQAKLGSALDEIAADAFYPSQVEALRKAVEGSRVGLDALRRSSERWLRARLSDPVLSLQSFGQRIAVAHDAAPALPRSTLIAELSASMIPDPQDLALTVLLGGEGAGKTWVAAQWWAALPDPPILLLVAGRRVDRLDPADPLKSLATLLAEQDGASDQAAIDGWMRRLRRWKDQARTDALRFVVLLDGLNERTDTPWADIIRGLAREIQALGGRLVVTSREAYWRRDVLPRLGSAFDVAEVLVPDFSDPELAALLATRNRSPSALPPAVRSFIRNPRVCAVALDLLDRLEVSPDELTVERLLLEYWRWRLEDRSHAITHSIDDFHKLLRGHARDWLKQPRREFARDDWADYSGAAKRLGLSRVLNDLGEIEDGRFLQIPPEAPGSYAFREDALPFALALLINEELTTGLRAASADADELLDRMLDPVQGFDQLASIVAAAAGLACMDDAFPPVGREALIRRWLGLQNSSDDAFRAMAAYLPSRPAAFLDLAELPAARFGPVAREQSLTSLLVLMRDHPAVVAALARRLPRWLGMWSRQAQQIANGEEQAKRQARHETAIDAALVGMSPSELALFRQLTTEVGEVSEMQLDRTAALLLAGRPQAAFAAGLFGWALAQSVAQDFHNGDAELTWAVRLNDRDWSETRRAAGSLISGLESGASPAFQRALARVLRLLGDVESSAKAERLVPRTVQRGGRPSDRFCDTDPYDPEALPGSNLDNSRNTLARLEPDQMWLHMSTTAEDLDLDNISPALARFDPHLLTAKLNAIAGTAPERTGLPLRQLAWRLPWIAPILDAATRDAVLAAYDALLADPTRVPADDRKWVGGQFLGALLPATSAEEQMALLAAMPPGSPLYLNLRRGLKPLTAVQLEERLEVASAPDGASETLARTLFHASGSTAALTERSRAIVAEAVFSPDAELSWAAADVVAYTDDLKLDELVLQKAAGQNTPPNDPEEAFARGRAIAKAVVRLDRSDQLDLLSPRFLNWASSKMPERVLARLADGVEATLARLMAPIAAEPPADFAYYYQTSSDDLDATAWVQDLPNPGDGDPHEVLRQMGDPETTARKHAARHKAALAQVRQYRRELTEEGAAALVSSPPREGLALLAAR